MKGCGGTLVVGAALGGCSECVFLSGEGEAGRGGGVRFICCRRKTLTPEL